MNQKPVRVQRKRTKGWRMPPNTVSVTRPGKWGNPFRIGDCVNGVILETAEAVVEKHRWWLNATINISEVQRELRGKNLACFCPLGSPCHADNLLRIANL